MKETAAALYSTFDQGDITLRWSEGRRIVPLAQNLSGLGHILMFDGGYPAVGMGLGYVVSQPRVVAGGIVGP